MTHQRTVRNGNHMKPLILFTQGVDSAGGTRYSKLSVILEPNHHNSVYKGIQISTIFKLIKHFRC